MKKKRLIYYVGILKTTRKDTLEMLSKIWYTVDGTRIQAYSYNYTYSDAWGNHSVTYTNGGASTGAQYNPFRYRGYYYDTDLGLYYLQSRYYDPNTCRFINADSALYHSMLGYNMFAYCENNPVIMIDITGQYCVAIMDDDGNLLNDWILEGASSGGYKAAGNYVGPGSSYYNYSVRSLTAAYDARLGGYHSNSVSSGITNTGYYFVPGAVSVTDDMAAGSSYNGACFVAGTLVKTAEGDVPIENIQVGDYVYAHNPETGETELKSVVNTFVNEATELVHVFADGEEIICTNEHPFYSPIKGWIAACKLRAGDILVSLNGEYVVVEQVQHEILEAPIKVYNFEVEDFHTYFVGDGDGVLVHNSCNHNSTWNSERRNYWKMRATTDELNHDYGAYKATANNIERMREGLAPKGWDGHSVQLHHPNGIANDFYNYYPVSRTFHIYLHIDDRRR